MVKGPAFSPCGLEAILALDFERVVVAHGNVVEHGGRKALRAGYEWLLSGQAAAR
jgi:hypothetical protein